jgi:hypothetical protein
MIGKQLLDMDILIGMRIDPKTHCWNCGVLLNTNKITLMDNSWYPIKLFCSNECKTKYKELCELK